MKYETKQKLKKYMGYAAAILAIVALMTTIGFITNGFTARDKDDLNFDFIEENENNLITPATFTKETYKTDTSVLINQKNGILTLSGKPDSKGSDVNAELGKIKLAAGTYTFTTGKDGVNNATNPQKYQLKLVNGSTEYIADIDESFTLATETELTVTLFVKAGVNVTGVKLYPVVVSGDTAQGFYAE